jgi:hypothetical protein
MNEQKNPSALDRMLDLRAEIEGRLLANDDYRTLVALNKAIAEINGVPMIKQPETPGQPKKLRPAEVIDFRGLTQADAAYQMLTQVLQEPAIVSRLVTALGSYAVTIGGTNPNINLSSVLSKDGRFRSVRYKDRASWWVHGTPFPGELETN